MVRFTLVLLIAVSNLFGFSQVAANTSESQIVCPTDLPSTSICQTYLVTGGDLMGKVDAIQVQIHHFTSGNEASKSFHVVSLEGYPSASERGSTLPGVALGDKYEYFPAAQMTSLNTSASYLKVREGNLISLWIAFGDSPDIATSLVLSFAKSEHPGNATSSTSDMSGYMPALAALPKGLESPAHLESADQSNPIPDKSVRTKRSEGSTNDKP